MVHEPLLLTSGKYSRAIDISKPQKLPTAAPIFAIFRGVLNSYNYGKP
jgi:hypothetical protein